QGPDSKHKNDNKVSGIKSNTTTGGQGFNELRFDDTKDKEQVFIHAEKNMDTRVKSASMESVGASKHVTVGGEKDGQKWGEYREHTFKDKHVAVDNMLQARFGDAKVLVGGGDGEGHLDLYVEGFSTTTVDGCVREHVKQQMHLDVDQDLIVEAQHVALKVDGATGCEAGGDFSFRSSTKVLLTAPEICLKGAGGFVKIDMSGVTIVGTVVNINSGGSATEAPGQVLGSNSDAEKAAPTAPTPADNAKTGQKSC
ncbi:MAG: hypothetical protein HY900_16195, partial [Deltaproteobacteria bacterium]|nr:hypothetical protein [Deltaproteobacteria bacterium]